MKILLGVGLFGGEILSAIGGEDDDVTDNSSIVETSWKQVVALSCGIPAVMVTIAMMPYFSLKTLQNMGFALISASFLLMAVCFYPLKKHYPGVLFALYCFLLFALQTGPNVTTFVLPPAVYPKEIRSTMNGLSAAFGKLGAVAGAYLFGAVAEVTSYPTVMIICAVLSAIGSVFTHFFIDDQILDENHDIMLD